MAPRRPTGSGGEQRGRTGVWAGARLEQGTRRPGCLAAALREGSLPRSRKARHRARLGGGEGKWSRAGQGKDGRVHLGGEVEQRTKGERARRKKGRGRIGSAVWMEEKKLNRKLNRERG
uniref:Uncharacterized protein n=1 Tax=Arundo donax TaxID=35708 RepID=A0A0A9G1A1_ARUDO